MSEAGFTVLETRNVIDDETADFSEGTLEAMEVEPVHSSESQPVDVGKPDQSWMQHGPWGGQQEDVDNDMPVPGSNSVKVESADLVSKGQDELVKTLGELVSKVIHLTDRVNTLEELVNKGTSSAASQPNHGSSASASQPQEDALAAPSASGSLHNKRKPARQFKAPRFQPWQMDSGECNKCHRSWSTAESPENFMVMTHVWEQAMNKMYEDFSMEGEWFEMKEGYVHSVDNLAQSLVACGVITAEEADGVASSLRRMVWQPDCPKDTRPMFLYKGGGKTSKYITFGCVRCQRATSLYYPSAHFMFHLRNHFP